MKKIKSFVAPFVISLVLATIINSFAFTVVKVGATTLDDYPKSSIHIVNKITNTFEVDDVILTKYEGVNIIRRIVSIEDNKVTLTDDQGNTIVVNYSDIKGKL